MKKSHLLALGIASFLLNDAARAIDPIGCFRSFYQRTTNSNNNNNSKPYIPTDEPRRPGGPLTNSKTYIPTDEPRRPGGPLTDRPVMAAPLRQDVFTRSSSADNRPLPTLQKRKGSKDSLAFPYMPKNVEQKPCPPQGCQPINPRGGGSPGAGKEHFEGSGKFAKTDGGGSGPIIGDPPIRGPRFEGNHDKGFIISDPMPILRAPCDGVGCQPLRPDGGGSATPPAPASKTFMGPLDPVFEGSSTGKKGTTLLHNEGIEAANVWKAYNQSSGRSPTVNEMAWLLDVKPAKELTGAKVVDWNKETNLGKFQSSKEIACQPLRPEGGERRQLNNSQPIKPDVRFKGGMSNSQPIKPDTRFANKKYYELSFKGEQANAEVKKMYVVHDFNLKEGDSYILFDAKKPKELIKINEDQLNELTNGQLNLTRAAQKHVIEVSPEKLDQTITKKPLN